MEKKNSNNFAFMGTPALSAYTLEIMKDNGYIPSTIITSPDTRSGRGMHINETPVALWAKENNIPCLKPEKLDDEFLEQFKKMCPDVKLSIVIAYGKILPQSVISFPSLGTINIHYSLLPKYRGATPVEQALLNGDEITGVTIQQMVSKLDSGPIIATEEVPVQLDEMKEELRSKLVEIGVQLLIKTLPDIFENKITLITQDESEATHCTKIKKEDGSIDPDGNNLQNYNKYRAYQGWPGVYFFKNEKRIKITKARYENNSFIIERVIPEGRKEIDYNLILK